MTRPRPDLPRPDLTDGTLTLRPWRPADAPAVARACTEGRVHEFVPHVPHPYTAEQALAWIAGQDTRSPRGEEFETAVVDATAEDDVWGALAVRARGDAVAELGYWLAPHARGRGVMTAAVRLVAAWAFDTAGMRRVQLTTDPDNHASQAVARRCGFTLEGRLRGHLGHPRTGLRRDSLMWGLLPGELVVG